jgi:23S rRNA pseudouridine2605 synthase
MRLNKLLAERAGIARRKADLAILAGEVEVDGEVVLTPGVDVDPEARTITLRGRALGGAPGTIHLLFHKPLGVLVTWSDPQGRPTVRDYVPPGMPRLFAVGRLDFDTSGLLVLTNDGALAHRLAHPRYEVPKRYRVNLEYPPTPEQLRQLEQGVDLGEGEHSSPATVIPIDRRVIDLVIAEGRKRQVRRMCKAVGLWLTALARIQFGPLTLGDLAPGKTRPLTARELDALRAASRGPGRDAKRDAGTSAGTSGVTEDEPGPKGRGPRR